MNGGKTEIISPHWKAASATLMRLHRMITAEHIADMERKHLCYLREEVFSQYGKVNKTGEGEQNG